MSILSKLTLTTTTPNAPLTPLARKRIKLLHKLEQQISAAEAVIDGEEFFEDIKRWVKRPGSNEKEQIAIKRAVKGWWWTNEHGALMVSLKDGNKIIPLDDKHSSVEVGGIEQLVSTLEALRNALLAGELDPQLEKIIAQRADRPMPQGRKSNSKAKADATTSTPQ